eukprot:3235462-Alexandrium_andersonii.AAC.1
MSASLVGSEMCIRDSQSTTASRVARRLAVVNVEPGGGRLCGALPVVASADGSESCPQPSQGRTASGHRAKTGIVASLAAV